MASTYLTRTPSSAGNRRTFTWSGWIKRASTSSTFYFGVGDLESDEANIGFESSSRIQYFDRTGGASPIDQHLISTASFRDTSGWYHIVLAVDTTQATASNRAKIYVNGEQLTAFDTEDYATQNYESMYNTTNAHYLGKRGHAPSYLDGSMAHVHFIDGTQYAASDFGQTDSTTGIWIPKTAPSVTYGTNGFFLKFENSGAMGTDSSGNSNTWSTGAGTLTQTQDTPSNVFCTLNSLTPVVTHSLTNASLTSTNSSATHGGANGTLNYPTSGKWYHEVKINAEDSSKGQGVGIGDNIYRPDWGTYSRFVAYLSDGTITAQGTGGYSSYGSAQNVGDIVGVAYNADDQELTFYLNGVSQGVIATSSMSGTLDFNNVCPIVFGRDMGQSFNFGNGYFGTTAVTSGNADDAGIGTFEYAPPTGYYALCTKNIASYG